MTAAASRKAATATLYIDGKAVGSGRIYSTEPALFSADETCDIGTEHGSAVTTDYGARDFNGTVNWVELDVGDDAKSDAHFLEPEQRLHIAMALQ